MSIAVYGHNGAPTFVKTIDRSYNAAQDGVDKTGEETVTIDQAGTMSISVRSDWCEWHVTATTA